MGVRNSAESKRPERGNMTVLYIQNWFFPVDSWHSSRYVWKIQRLNPKDGKFDEGFILIIRTKDFGLLNFRYQISEEQDKYTLDPGHKNL